jgi:hypothetical protein
VKHSVDILAVLGFIAAGGLAAFAQPLSALFPTHDSTIVNSVAIVTAAAAGALRVYYNQTDAPATSIAAGAPIVPAKPLVPPSYPPKAV